MTSERRTIDPTLLNTLALLAIVAGAVVTAYGIGYGVVKYYQYKPVFVPEGYIDARTDRFGFKRLEQSFRQADAQMENQRRATLRQQATEKAIHIAAVGGIILFCGVVLIAVAKRAPSRFT
jgi:hypothetical protein